MTDYQRTEAERLKKVEEMEIQRKKDNHAYLKMISFETTAERNERLMKIFEEKTRRISISKHRFYEPPPPKAQLQWATANKDSLRFNIDYYRKTGRNNMDDKYYCQLVVDEKKAKDICDALIMGIECDDGFYGN